MRNCFKTEDIALILLGVPFIGAERILLEGDSDKVKERFLLAENLGQATQSILPTVKKKKKKRNERKSF